MKEPLSLFALATWFVIAMVLYGMAVEAECPQPTITTVEVPMPGCPEVSELPLTAADGGRMFIVHCPPAPEKGTEG